MKYIKHSLSMYAFDGDKIIKTCDIWRGIAENNKKYWCVFVNGTDIGHEKTRKQAISVCKSVLDNSF